MPSSFNTILSNAWVCSTSPPVSVSGTVHMRGFFPGSPSLPTQSVKDEQLTGNVTSRGHRTINLFPIAYGCRPRLRGRLTPRGIAWRGNPWTFGGSVSHTPVATHVSILTSDTSSMPRGTPSQAYGTLRYRSCEPAASVYGFSPGTSSARDDLNLDQ